MYTFVFKHGGWWLFCTDLKTLEDFHAATDGVIFGDALRFRLDTKDQYHSTYGRSATLDRAIELIAEDNHSSYFEAAEILHKTIIHQQADAIKKEGGIYINPVGGYHCVSSKPTNHPIYRSEKLVWPKLTKRDIKISKFEGGQHYYAKVGTVEVKDANGIKWNTYEEAYAKALELLN